MCSYAHMLGKSTPKMAAIFVIVRKANSPIIPEPTARSAVRGLLIPTGFLHPGEGSISQVWSSSNIAGAYLYMGGHLTDRKIWRTVMKRAAMIGRI